MAMSFLIDFMNKQNMSQRNYCCTHAAGWEYGRDWEKKTSKNKDKRENKGIRGEKKGGSREEQLEKLGDQWEIKQSSIKNFFSTKISQTYRIPEAGKDLWRSPGPAQAGSFPAGCPGVPLFSELEFGVPCSAVPSQCSRRALEARFACLIQHFVWFIYIVTIHSWRKVTEASGLGKRKCTSSKVKMQEFWYDITIWDKLIPFWYYHGSCALALQVYFPQLNIILS